MRSRLATLLALVAVLACLWAPPVAWAQEESPAGDEESFEEAPGEDVADDDSREPEGEEGTESDEGGGEPSEEEGEEGAAPAEEAGPPWTYQMARLTIALVALLALAIGMAYYRFVVRRQRGEV